MNDKQVARMNTINRRQLLQRCAIGSLGWTIIDQLTGSSSASIQPKPIRACIFVFLYGGPSHIDTFDMKPQAPSEIRGEFKPISTSVPGLHISEHLPNLSRVINKFALIRSMHHTNRLHDSASTETFTGRQGPKGDREEFAAIPQFFPCHGSVIHAVRDQLKLDVHHATLPWLFHNVIDVPCQGGGFLGSAFDPLVVKGDPSSSKFKAQSLERQSELPDSRLLSRLRLLQSIDATQSLAPMQSDRLNRLYGRAFELLGSERIHKAIRIDEEPESIRKRYGLNENAESGKSAGAAAGRNLRGQSLLMARRLVEAGVPFVNVNDFRQQGQNWDSHADNFGQHRKFLLPAIDKGLSALISDLDDRGLLDSTLVVVTGEFGRTPTINAQAGRDHWPDCYTTLLAGGGIQNGAILGASDRRGAYPDRDPVSLADLAATIYWRFGIDPTTEIHDLTGRPYRLSDGSPLSTIFHSSATVSS